MHGVEITRRRFIKASCLSGMAMALSRQLPGETPKPAKPNFLWITSEDNGPFLGCYGDSFATTPHLDKLASEGALYENAFANAPVCAPARFTIITGTYAPAMGTQHMRSTNAIPARIRFLPQYLREAGYYCANNPKEDYNTLKPAGAWNESSGRAHYRKRATGQPFFSVFNLAVSHESSIHKSSGTLKHDPARVVLPPYHPDTPEIRHDWAQYYDKVQEMDAQAGKLLRELEEAGLAEDTIVFYFADNGGVLPRSKRFLYDSGTRIPLIIRFPKRFQHLAPGKPGAKLNRLVSFVDLAPTLLNLAGIEIPAHMQGQAFLGPRQQPPRQYVYLFRDRMDERYDLMRAVRNKRFEYIRNYMPHRIYGQHLEYLWRAPAARSWERAYREGKCNEAQSAFWKTKPAEELYDIKADPHEVRNLAHDPEYRDVLSRMRRANAKWIREIHDTGFIPEAEMLERIGKGNAFDVVQDKEYPLERIIETAEAASENDPGRLPLLLERLRDKESIVRYWAATGCAALGEKAGSAADQIGRVLSDPCASVRVAAAEAMCRMGRPDQGIPVLIAALKSTNPRLVLHALNVLESLGQQARPALAATAALTSEGTDPHAARAAEHLAAALKE